jgi:transmembrane sensor
MRGLGSQILQHSLWIGITGALVLGIAVLTRHRSGSDSEITRTYATRAYQQATLNLADGTRITLAPQTAVRLLHFGASVRTVLLDSGEAYFEVAHAAGVPFIVKSGPATTQVLGTAFLVRHIAGDSQVLVAVADGKVRIRTLSHRDAGVLLTSRHIGAVTDSTVHVSAVNDIDPRAQWSRDHMLFRDTPLAIVLQTISQWYGYRFRYADRTMGAQKVTIMVSAKSSAEALATVEQVLAVNLTVNGDTITLVPKPEQSEQTAPRIRTYDVWTPTREVGR